MLLSTLAVDCPVALDRGFARAPEPAFDEERLLDEPLAVDCLLALDCGFVREPDRPFDDERLLDDAVLFRRFDPLFVCWAIRPFLVIVRGWVFYPSASLEAKRIAHLVQVLRRMAIGASGV